MRTPTENKTAKSRCTCSRCQAHDAGRRGPYTPSEFVEIFGAVNEKAPVELSYELALLGAEVDLAIMRVDRAKAVWAAAREARAKRAGEGEYVYDANGLGRPRPKDPKADEVEAAEAVYREMADALRVARRAYTARAQEEERDRARADYEAGQEALRATRGAPRVAPEAQGIFDRLRAKVLSQST